VEPFWGIGWRRSLLGQSEMFFQWMTPRLQLWIVMAMAFYAWVLVVESVIEVTDMHFNWKGSRYPGYFRLMKALYHTR